MFQMGNPASDTLRQFLATNLAIMITDLVTTQSPACPSQVLIPDPHLIRQHPESDKIDSFGRRT
jgi:hypothetical protein